MIEYKKGDIPAEETEALVNAVNCVGVMGRGSRSVEIPPLGSGLGGLDWAEVRTRVEGAMQNLPDVRIVVFEPQEAPAPRIPGEWEER
jgi:O-acetyl-ADP-ribose deacetylase (regulator of RNase III)